MTKRRRKKKRHPFRLERLPILLGMIIFFVAIVVLMISLKSINFSSNHSKIETSDKVAHTEFIESLVPVAKELQQTYGMLPSIILGQAILESDWGQSELGARYNNLFGIKSYDSGDNAVKLATKEYQDGNWVDINANFKVYNSWDDCVREHTQLFFNGVDWDPYLYQGVLLADDYKTAARALQNAGYATDPDYAQKIVDVIEANKLYQYDQ